MIKTRLQHLEELYDTFYSHQIQTELVMDALQARIIITIDPKAKEIRDKMETQLARFKQTIADDQKAMDRVMERIKIEEKKRGLVEINKVVITKK